MAPAPTPVKFRKTIYDSHLAEWRNTEVFSLDLLIPTTCHSKKLKFRPPMENPRPALRGGVAGWGAHKRPPRFILLFFQPPRFTSLLSQLTKLIKAIYLHNYLQQTGFIVEPDTGAEALRSSRSKV